MRKKLEEKLMAYRLLQARIESLERQHGVILARIAEMENALKGLEEIKKIRDIVFSMGANVYLPAATHANRAFINVGAGVVLEKNLDEAIEILQKRKKELEGLLVEIRKNLRLAGVALQDLIPEIKKLVE